MSKSYLGNDVHLGTDDEGRPVSLTQGQRRLHTWIPGRTGVGKSRLLQSMVWQDIQKWPRSRHGVLLLDPDGETYDQVVRRLAQHPLAARLPIVLIDLRRTDHVIAYNLLKRRKGDDPAVTALNLLEAITTAFGDVDVMAKPTLYRTAVTILRALIEAELSLAHAPMVLDPARGELREYLCRFITDPIALANLARINNKSVADKTGRMFDEETLAFANRMFGPLSNHLLRHMFGQTQVSFDFDWALEEGAIVLVSLATEGNKVTETDARMVGSLLLADMWQAARRRGKRAGGGVRGFYVYADEFQTMLSPVIAAQLSRARGYGLYFTLANQLPSQLRDNAADGGDAIYHAVLGNTANKIVFRSSTSEEDLRPLSRAIFLGQVDVDKVKDIITSHQVVGHREIREVLRGGSETTSQTVSRGLSVGHTEGQSHTQGSQRGAGSNSSIGRATPIDPDAAPGAGTETEGSGESSSESSTEQDGISFSNSIAHSRAVNSGHGKTRSWAQSIRMVPVIQERVSSRTFESVENQLFAYDQLIASLPARHAYAMLAGSFSPTRMCTVHVPDATSSPILVEHCRCMSLRQLPFALSTAIAEANLSHLGASILPTKIGHDHDELVSFARKRTPRRPESKEADHDE